LTTDAEMDLRFVVTGSKGRLGREQMSYLDRSGFWPVGIVSRATVETGTDGEFVHRKVDLSGYGEAVDGLWKCAVVVHLANISYPGFYPGHQTFTQNVAMNHNVFSAVCDVLKWHE